MCVYMRTRHQISICVINIGVSRDVHNNITYMSCWSVQGRTKIWGKQLNVNYALHANAPVTAAYVMTGVSVRRGEREQFQYSAKLCFHLSDYVKFRNHPTWAWSCGSGRMSCSPANQPEFYKRRMRTGPFTWPQWPRSVEIRIHTHPPKDTNTYKTYQYFRDSSRSPVSLQMFV